MSVTICSLKVDFRSEVMNLSLDLSSHYLQFKVEVVKARKMVVTRWEILARMVLKADLAMARGQCIFPPNSSRRCRGVLIAADAHGQ